jgi:hypothetical protein
MIWLAVRIISTNSCRDSDHNPLKERRPRPGHDHEFYDDDTSIRHDPGFLIGFARTLKRIISVPAYTSGRVIKAR